MQPAETMKQHDSKHKAAIYARFSSDLQSERSIDDQVELCRAFAAREHLDVISTFSDRARSGASVFDREGLLSLMDAARDGAFNVVIVEALDRLSRDQEDLAGLWKRLKFLGVEICAVHDGKADIVQIGIRGLVGALYLQDLAHKVRRGMSGVVRDGRHAGGRAYGYRPQPGIPGKLQIVEAEADVVRRIFTDYIAGITPRAIAHALNNEDIPAPRGQRWNASTINGNASRGAGILQNELYVGRLVWNKVRMIKDPETGRRISRPNATEDRQIISVPDLTIVSDEVFEAARARKAGAARPESYRKQRYLLSGLLKCGACGSGMSVQGRDKSGKRRIQCSAFRESGTCNHGRKYYLDVIERQTVNGLRDELRDPLLIAEYVRTYIAETQQRAQQTSCNRDRLTKKLGETKRAISRLVDLLANGETKIDAVRERLISLEQEQKTLEADLAATEEQTPVIALHPGAVESYLRQVEDLAAALNANIDVMRAGSPAALRNLVDRVIVHPSGPGQPFTIEVVGHLAELLGEPNMPPSSRFAVAESKGGVSVVAGEGLEPPTYGL